MPYFEDSILKRALEKNLFELEVLNLRDFSANKYQKADHTLIGGGAGQILDPEMIENVLHLIGLSVVEENEILGKVIEIQRISQTDYFMVETTLNLVGKGLAKIFLIPYRDFYIQEILLQDKKITTHNAKTLLENS
nr:hypothetical protein [Helicobacter pylori]